MDRMVEIACFSYPADAQVLMSLLRDAGIECYLRNELTTQVFSGYVDVGGARLEILEKDLPEALRVMAEGGFPLPESGGGGEALPKLPAMKRRLLAYAVFAVLLALGIYFASILLSN